jgi:hypothetical protein
MAALHHPAAHDFGEDRRGILRQLGFDLDAHAHASQLFASPCRRIGRDASRTGTIGTSWRWCSPMGQR